jgi:histidinol dehydrogenase
MTAIIEITDDASYQAALTRLCPPNASPGADPALREKEQSVAAIIDAVRERGDDAVAEFTERFDGVSLRPDQFELSKADVDQALTRVDPGLIATLERAHGNIKNFHGKHLRQSWEEIDEDGTIIGQRITPIERVGVYVPGQKAFYPSSVLMNIVPARVAGVKEIIMVAPPSYDGSIHPVVLAAARIAGATRIFRIGGAQAIAALAFGTQHVPAVLKITGPGNTYVNIAKRMVSGICDIDKEAGPSEVVVIADEKSNPKFVAAEMLAQAEHDEEARCLCFATSMEFAQKVRDELIRQAVALPKREIIETALAAQGLIVVVRSVNEAAELANEVAPEHLSIQTEVPRKVFARIQNAGAAMLGGMTSVAVGDYYAGPNHILPTGRRARFASPLTAEDFRKVTSIISYTHERLVRDADDIRRLAIAEQLQAHANAVEMRR